MSSLLGVRFSRAARGRRKFSMFFVYLYTTAVAMAQSYSDSNAIRYANGANGPESKTTRMFRPVRQVAATGGCEVCRLRLHCTLLDI